MASKYLLALAATCALGAASANAALVQFSQGDLVMGFRATSGIGAGTTYVVSLGAASAYRDLGAYGTLDGSNAATIDLGDIGADLAAIYGANWSTRTDLFWGVAGSPSNNVTVAGDPEDTLYASRTSASAWSIASPTTRGNVSTRMVALATAFDAYQSTANSASGAQQSDTDVNGWRSFMAAGGVNAPSNLDFGGFSNIEGNPTQSLNLFRLSDTNGTLEGTFSISSGGVVTFVPEPASAMLAGLGSVLLAFRRRRNA